MELTAIDKRLLAAIERGLPLTAYPYADVGRTVGLSESEVIAGLRALRDAGVIRRFGVIVRHRALGYRSNAMTVWDVPDGRVRKAGQALAKLPYVTLAYRRPRRLPEWPYNLFCMIHGRERGSVMRFIDDATEKAGLANCDRAILFSAKAFKQRGARYAESAEDTSPRQAAQ